MAQYVFTMNRVGKIVPPKRQILKDISLSFFPGAKIGVLGLNGAGKSTLLKIMAGVDQDHEGEAIPMAGIKMGYLPQEPALDPEKTVRETVEEGMGEVMQAQAKLDAVYAAYAEPDADFDALAAEQARLEAIIAAAGTDAATQMEIAADALRLRRGMQRSAFFRAAKSAAWRSVVFCFRVPTCFCSMNRQTTLTRNLLIGSSSFCTAFRERWWRLPMIATSLTMLRNGFWSSTAGKAFPGRAIIPRGLIRRKNVWKLKSVRKTLA